MREIARTSEPWDRLPACHAQAAEPWDRLPACHPQPPCHAPPRTTPSETSSPEQTAAWENPFASRYVRPGALPFAFPAGMDAAQLVERLKSQRWRGAVVGPHGSGKSTLLADLEDELQREGCSVKVVTHATLRAAEIPAAGTAPAVLLVDGWEQLSRWRRWLVRRQCRRRGYGLIVTSHRVMDVPILISTSASVQLAIRLVRELAGAAFAGRHDAFIRASFDRHGGNLREVLFDLYDRYERSHRAAGPGAGASRQP